jgi:hypothetical protein
MTAAAAATDADDRPVDKGDDASFLSSFRLCTSSYSVDDIMVAKEESCRSCNLWVVQMIDGLQIPLAAFAAAVTVVVVVAIPRDGNDSNRRREADDERRTLDDDGLGNRSI